MKEIIKDLTKTKKGCFVLMRTFECIAGEDFIDQNENFVVSKCMLFWMLGKGYIDGTSVVGWTKDKFVNLQSILYDEDYSVFKGLCISNEDVHDKSLEILAELICSVSIYQERLEKLLVDMFEHYEEDINEYINSFNEEYDMSCKLSIYEIMSNHTDEYEEY